MVRAKRDGIATGRRIGHVEKMMKEKGDATSHRKGHVEMTMMWKRDIAEILKSHGAWSMVNIASMIWTLEREMGRRIARSLGEDLRMTFALMRDA